MQYLRKLNAFVFSSPWPYRLLRIGIGLLFLWAGTVKLADPKAFARAIANYELLPDPLLVPAALGIPTMEVLAGVGLLLDIGLGLRLTFGLLLFFLGVVAYAMLKGLDIDCGCFSADEIMARSDLKITFLRDIALTCTVLFLLYCRRVRNRTETETSSF